ncbi:MAG: DUF92 domain-containing protein, partial [Candidatus Hodarchaeales archaeon]
MSINEIDILVSILIVSYVVFWLFLTEILGRYQKLSKSNARKLLHIVLGNVILLVPFFGDFIIAISIPLLFIPINYFLSPNSPIKKLRLDTFEAGHAWGTVLYPISLTIIVFFCYDNPWLLIACFFPLAYGDGLAAVIGERANKGFFSGLGGQKTLIGSWTFIWASFVSVFVGLFLLKFFDIITFSIEFIIFASIIVAILATLIELLSPKGTDNLFIPIILLIILLYIEDFIIEGATSVDLTYFAIGFLISSLFGITGYVLKFLTFDGVLAGVFFGLIIMGIGGWTLGIALLLFFIGGSIVTKYSKKHSRNEIVFEKGGTQRDSLQAFAKAGIASAIALLIPFYNDSVYLIIIVIATMGTSLADTMGTEIGTLS